MYVTLHELSEGITKYDLLLSSHDNRSIKILSYVSDDDVSTNKIRWNEFPLTLVDAVDENLLAHEIYLPVGDYTYEFFTLDNEGARLNRVESGRLKVEAIDVLLGNIPTVQYAQNIITIK